MDSSSSEDESIAVTIAKRVRDRALGNVHIHIYDESSSSSSLPSSFPSSSSSRPPLRFVRREIYRLNLKSRRLQSSSSVGYVKNVIPEQRRTMMSQEKGEHPSPLLKQSRYKKANHVDDNEDKDHSIQLPLPLVVSSPPQCLSSECDNKTLTSSRSRYPCHRSCRRRHPHNHCRVSDRKGDEILSLTPLQLKHFPCKNHHLHHPLACVSRAMPSIDADINEDDDLPPPLWSPPSNANNKEIYCCGCCCCDDVKKKHCIEPTISRDALTSPRELLGETDVSDISVTRLSVSSNDGCQQQIIGMKNKAKQKSVLVVTGNMKSHRHM